MNEHNETTFDEALLSGYLDGELTQADRQRVRLHLEDDAEARSLVEEMAEIREVARSGDWVEPSDEQWNEAPRSSTSRFLRGTGWLLLGAWLAVVAVAVLWGLIFGPESWGEKALALAVVGGPLALFISVLIDRLKVMQHDRYRSVEK